MAGELTVREKEMLLNIIEKLHHLSTESKWYLLGRIDGTVADGSGQGENFMDMVVSPPEPQKTA